MEKTAGGLGLTNPIAELNPQVSDIKTWVCRVARLPLPCVWHGSLAGSDPIEGKPPSDIRCATAPAPDVQPNLLCPVVLRAKFRLEPVDVVLVVLPRRPVGEDGYRMEIRVVVPPELESLNHTHAPDASKSIRPRVHVGPDDVDVVVIEEGLPAHVALKSDRAVDRRELILHLHDSVVGYSTAFARVLKSVWHSEGQEALHVCGVGIRSVASMEGMGKDIINRHYITSHYGWSRK